jgi:hypothetical protein
MAKVPLLRMEIVKRSDDLLLVRPQSASRQGLREPRRNLGHLRYPRLYPAGPQAARQGVGCGPRYTVTKVGKSDCEGTFAGASGNDEDAPIPVARKGGLPLANSRPIADLRLGEHIVSDVSEANIGERNSIRAVIAVCCAWS